MCGGRVSGHVGFTCRSVRPLVSALGVGVALRTTLVFVGPLDLCFLIWDGRSVSDCVVMRYPYPYRFSRVMGGIIGGDGEAGFGGVLRRRG